MSEEVHWKKFNYCQTCGKGLTEEAAKGHKLLKHKVEEYKTISKKTGWDLVGKDDQEQGG